MNFGLNGTLAQIEASIDDSLKNYDWFREVIIEGNIEVVQVFFNHGYELQKLDLESPATAIHDSLLLGNYDTAQVLIDNSGIKPTLSMEEISDIVHCTKSATILTFLIDNKCLNKTHKKELCDFWVQYKFNASYLLYLLKAEIVDIPYLAYRVSMGCTEVTATSISYDLMKIVWPEMHAYDKVHAVKYIYHWIVSIVVEADDDMKLYFDDVVLLKKVSYCDDHLLYTFTSKGYKQGYMYDRKLITHLPTAAQIVIQGVYKHEIMTKAASKSTRS